jgi:hypothetical protein
LLKHDRPDADLSGMARFSRPRGGDVGDRGSIVIGWLTKIAVALGLAGLVLFDAISIGTTTVSLTDEGDYAARAASENWVANKSVQKAYDAAVAAATEQNPANHVATKTFRIDADGTVHLTISREATTLVVYRIGPIKKWADIEREGSGRDIGS